MKLSQISVFVENRTGRVGEVTNLLAAADVNIRVISLADTHDFGIIRLIVNDVEKALTVLRDNQFTVQATDVVAVEISDAPGALSRILNLLAEHKIDVAYLYGFVERSGEKAILIFRFDAVDRAVDVLKENQIRILSGEDLYSL